MAKINRTDQKKLNSCVIKFKINMATNEVRSYNYNIFDVQELFFTKKDKKASRKTGKDINIIQ